MIIGITGGIGAGKSMVSRILRLKGYPVYDCDSEARRIMEGSGHIKQCISDRLGSGCINTDGSLNRQVIARHVFASESHRMWLNSLVHGMVRDDVALRAARTPGENFFVESAILSTSGLDRMCGAIWLVEAPELVRIARAAYRDGSSVESVRLRIDSQKSEFEAISRHSRTVHIDNGGITPILPQIEDALALCAAAESAANSELSDYSK